MKILKPKNLMSILYGVLLAFPMFAILSRVIYVQTNKNAYQSYSETQVQKIEQINNAQSYADTFTYNVKPINTQHTTSPAQYFSYISIDNVNSNAVYFKIYDNRTSVYRIYFYDSNDTELQYFTWANPNTDLNDFNEFYFTKTAGNNLYNYANIFLIYETTDKLDNVFDYSVNQFIKYNNFGQIDLTSWFSGLFLSNASINQQYVNFINWYLNYAMLVSCMYILFLVLMGFVNFARRVLERGMNAGYDW